MTARTDGFDASGGAMPGLYIHVPFCARKCIYCDFASYAGCSEEVTARYFDAMCAEADALTEHLGEGVRFDTVFIGGGTPSVVEAAHIRRVLGCVPLCNDAEITIEANPGSLTPEKAQIYAGAGVNRISIGMQSAVDEELRFLGRIHTAAMAADAVKAARSAGIDNISLDLIFGFPGQTFESWKYSLDQALELNVRHLSFYSLQIEEGTKLYDMFRRNEVDQISEDEDRAMYHYAVLCVKKNGFHHYEISNAARPGYECRHNLKYWSMDDYAGIGAGAHSFLNGCRFANPNGIEEYISKVRKAVNPCGRPDYKLLHEMIPNTVEESMSDCVFTCLRKMDGLDTGRFEKCFGLGFMDIYGERVMPFLSEGLLSLDTGLLRFTDKGLDISNFIIGALI